MLKEKRMPKGRYEKTEEHKQKCRDNGKKQSGKSPSNAKYYEGYVQGDFSITKRLTPIGYKLSNGKRYTNFLCRCNNCGELKEISAHDFSAGYKIKCSEKKLPSNWTGYRKISGSYWKRIQKQAAERKLEFSISIEYAWTLFEKQQQKCKYSGVELSFSGTKMGNLASLDRIDSKKGYVEGNVHWVHKDVNMMKRNFTEEYFINLCETVYKNFISKKQILNT